MHFAVWWSWVVVVLLTARRFRPLQPPPLIRVASRPSNGPTNGLGNRLLIGLGRLVERTIVPVARLLGRELPPRTQRELSSLGVATLVTALGAAISPPLCGLAWIAVVFRRRVHLRRRDRARTARIAAELPDVVELLAIAISSGANLTQAVDLAVADDEGLVADALRSCRQATGMGVRMIDALAALPTQLGDASRPLVTTLVMAERHGIPLVQALRQLATEMKAERRRSAEESARRVPVRLLGPLVLLLLPAFALLTVAPLLAGGLRSLRL